MAEQLCALLGKKINGSNQKVAFGTFANSNSAQVTVNIGFTPKYLATLSSNTSGAGMNIYNADVSMTKAFYAGSSTSSTFFNLGGSTNYRLARITANGFVMNKCGTGTSYYFAIG